MSTVPLLYASNDEPYVETRLRSDLTMEFLNKLFSDYINYTLKPENIEMTIECNFTIELKTNQLDSKKNSVDKYVQSTTPFDIFTKFKAIKNFRLSLGTIFNSVNQNLISKFEQIGIENEHKLQCLLKVDFMFKPYGKGWFIVELSDGKSCEKLENVLENCMGKKTKFYSKYFSCEIDFQNF